MKIALYGGSFDPIHIGHINLAIEMLETHHLDEVWFCPAANNPHKKHHTTASSQDRLQMLLLATKDIPQFKVIDIELNRPPPSFTIDTLNQLLAEYTSTTAPEFYLIIGDDAASHFHTWHQPEEIIKKATLLVGRRDKNIILNSPNIPPIILNALKKGMTSSRILEVSSTEIRSRLSENLYCGHLLHMEVLDYIVSHRLYSNLQYSGDFNK